MNGELPLWIEVTSSKRDQFAEFMSERKIEVRKATPSLNASPHLADTRTFPNSKFYEQSLLVLPSGPDQHPKDIERTLEALTEFNDQ